MFNPAAVHAVIAESIPERERIVHGDLRCTRADVGDRTRRLPEVFRSALYWRSSLRPEDRRPRCSRELPC